MSKMFTCKKCGKELEVEAVRVVHTNDADVQATITTLRYQYTCEQCKTRYGVIKLMSCSGVIEEDALESSIACPLKESCVLHMTYLLSSYPSALEDIGSPYTDTGCEHYKKYEVIAAGSDLLGGE